MLPSNQAISRADDDHVAQHQRGHRASQRRFSLDVHRAASRGGNGADDPVSAMGGADQIGDKAANGQAGHNLGQEKGQHGERLGKADLDGAIGQEGSARVSTAYSAAITPPIHRRRVRLFLICGIPPFYI